MPKPSRPKTQRRRPPRQPRPASPTREAMPPSPPPSTPLPTPPPRPLPKPKQRRALTHVGGEVDLYGDPHAANDLADALEVDPASDDEDAARAHVHGFHTY